MKLDKAKILEAETKLSTLLKDLIQVTTRNSDLTTNQLLKLV